MGSGGARAKFPPKPKSHLLKWKKPKGVGPSRLGRLGLGSGTVDVPYRRRGRIVSASSRLFLG
jgi:hypothetical protein